MARYPGAKWRPISKAYRYGKMDRHDGAVLHVSASDSATSLYGWWQNPGSGDNGSHFHVAKDGTVEQYVDTSYIAWTSRSGSRRTIGIETQGGASGKWTAAQVAAIVKLLIWCADTHNFPKRDMKNSRPSSRGIGTHRYGIDPWRVSGGQVWGGRGKVCPGNDRQKQVPGIIRAVASGSTTPGATPSTPKPKEYFDMDKKTFESGLDAAFKRNAEYLIDKLFAARIKVSGGLAKRLGVKTMNVSTILRHSAANLTESREKFTQTWRRLNNQNEVLRRIANQTVTNEKELKEINDLLDERLPEPIEIKMEDLED